MRWCKLTITPSGSPPAHKPGHSHSVGDKMGIPRISSIPETRAQPQCGRTGWELPGLESPQAALGSSPGASGSSTEPRATRAAPKGFPEYPPLPRIQDFTFPALRNNTEPPLGHLASVWHPVPTPEGILPSRMSTASAAFSPAFHQQHCKSLIAGEEGETLLGYARKEFQNQDPSSQALCSAPSFLSGIPGVQTSPGQGCGRAGDLLRH